MLPLCFDYFVVLALSFFSAQELEMFQVCFASLYCLSYVTIPSLCLFFAKSRVFRPRHQALEKDRILCQLKVSGGVDEKRSKAEICCSIVVSSSLSANVRFC